MVEMNLKCIVNHKQEQIHDSTRPKTVLLLKLNHGATKINIKFQPIQQLRFLAKLLIDKMAIELKLQDSNKILICIILFVHISFLKIDNFLRFICRQ